MTEVDNLTDFASQQTILTLGDGTSATVDLEFHSAAERWVINVEYNGRQHNGIGLCDHPNILRQFMNVFPFGLSCVTADQTDPFDVNDFSNGRVKLYLLTKADVDQVERDIFTAP